MTDLLTDIEKEAIDFLGKAVEKINKICLSGSNREQGVYDWAEMCVHLHALQRSILSHAACRAYPEEYRLMGSSLND